MAIEIEDEWETNDKEMGEALIAQYNEWMDGE